MRTFLVAIDFSESALNAAKYATAFASRVEASRIILYHSLDALHGYFDIAQLPEAINESTVDEAAHKLTEIKLCLLAIDPSIEIACEIDHWNLIEGINRIQAREAIDLIVVGRTGKSRLSRLLLGSNTARLCATCDTPLLVIPASISFKPIKRMALACDFKEVTATIPVNIIKGLTNKLGAELLVVNVDYREEEYYDPHMITQQYALHALLDNLKATYFYVDSKSERQGILKFAREQEVQLILLIKKQHALGESFLHRSVSKEMALYTTIPVLLIKPTETKQ